MKATETFERLTARSLGGQGLEWVAEMVDRWGDVQVAAALEETASGGKLDKLLSRTRDALAKAEITSRRRQAPAEVSGATMLDVARGQIPEPTRPYVYDLADLTAEQYTEVLRWKEQEAEAGRK